MLCVQQIVNFGGLKQSRARTLPYGRVILREQLRGEHRGSIVSVCLNFVFRPPPRPAASALRRPLGPRLPFGVPCPMFAELQCASGGRPWPRRAGKKESMLSGRTNQNTAPAQPQKRYSSMSCTTLKGRKLKPYMCMCMHMCMCAWNMDMDMSCMHMHIHMCMCMCRARETLRPTWPMCSGTVLYVLTVPSAAEYWQAVVRANVGAVRQPLVDAPGVEDVGACVVKRHRNRDCEQAAE